MSAAVKYLTKKVARLESEALLAGEERRKASKNAEECEKRHWEARTELGDAIDADIDKAKAELSA
jgi:hypothetical protein